MNLQVAARYKTCRPQVIALIARLLPSSSILEQANLALPNVKDSHIFVRVLQKAALAEYARAQTKPLSGIKSLDMAFWLGVEASFERT